jgi:polyhydroxybutyrate depolymerase
MMNTQAPSDQTDSSAETDQSTSETSAAPGNSSGSDETSAPSDQHAASAGCESGAKPKACDTSGTPCTIDVDGTEREYYVVLPDSYDETQPYPVVFQYHPLGGSAEQGMNMYGIRENFSDAIYVTPQGLSGGGNTGFANTDGSDEAMTRAIIAAIESTYCIDTSRYFAAGFSYGGSMSFTAACNMSDIFRGIGAMAGAPISGAACTRETPARRVAIWATHGIDDSLLGIELARPMVDTFVELNGCSTTRTPTQPAPCEVYDGCDEGYPVVWCERTDANDPGGQNDWTGHSFPAFTRKALADFFISL